MNVPGTPQPDFVPALWPLIAEGLQHLAVRLSALDGVSSQEGELIVQATRTCLEASLHRKLCRTLVVELNRARVGGRLDGETPEERWYDFLRHAAEASFWRSLDQSYPSMRSRVDRVIANVCGASLFFAEAWAADRPLLHPILGRPAGRLLSLSFAAGDSHRGGRSVAIVESEGGRLVYKPRSVGPERVLADFLDALTQAHGRAHGMATPLVVDRGEHGWAAFVEHVYVADPQALKAFYKAMGGWLAVTRLLSATDLHAENLIAHGGSPVVIDAETLFTPRIDPKPTGLGDAADEAMRLIAGTVVMTGLLPNRGTGLAWRGVDISGMGALPGEQPMMQIPMLIDAGTDRARIGTGLVSAEAAQNHPAEAPSLAAHWPDVLVGFDDLTATLKRMDAVGRLQPLLAAFQDCEVRVVTRATEVYAELARMLWHPVSLHDEAAAKARAVDLLARMAANLSAAPADPDVIAAEVEDLLVGDVPFFSTRVGHGRLRGPGGTVWLDEADLAQAALEDWRTADLELERDYIRATLANAYGGDRSRAAVRRKEDEVSLQDLEDRRRAAAGALMRRYISSAILGADGTATWVASSLTPSGWALQPLGVDLYGGLYGVGLVAAAYIREMQAGRAIEIEGTRDLLHRIEKSINLFEDQQVADRDMGAYVRPPPPGAYLGLGSQIWGRLASGEITGRCDLAKAERLAAGIRQAASADETLDLLAGKAGAIPPLLKLAQASGNTSWTELACEIGDDLLERAEIAGEGLFWRDPAWPSGLGGFAHGATGIGWALARLAAATSEARYGDAALRAFRFEDDLFDDAAGAWRDLRGLADTPTSAAWCHGSVGIGLAHLDLDPDLVQREHALTVGRAVSATLRDGLGWSSCACHGDVGCYELFDRARKAGIASPDLYRETMLARLLPRIEAESTTPTTSDLQPGLLVGQGGVLYALLNLGGGDPLPSFLTLD